MKKEDENKQKAINVFYEVSRKVEPTKTIAIESLTNGVLRYYGFGKNLGDLIVGDGPMTGLPNPCIKLDSGSFVWGFECWWTTNKQFCEQFGHKIEKIIEVPAPSNIKPQEKPKS